MCIVCAWWKFCTYMVKYILKDRIILTRLVIVCTILRKTVWWNKNVLDQCMPWYYVSVKALQKGLNYTKPWFLILEVSQNCETENFMTSKYIFSVGLSNMAAIHSVSIQDSQPVTHKVLPYSAQSIGLPVKYAQQCSSQCCESPSQSLCKITGQVSIMVWISV